MNLCMRTNCFVLIVAIVSTIPHGCSQRPPSTASSESPNSFAQLEAQRAELEKAIEMYRRELESNQKDVADFSKANLLNAVAAAQDNVLMFQKQLANAEAALREVKTEIESHKQK